MEQRTAVRSALRNFRAPAKAERVPTVKSPVGAQNSTTAGNQARALRQPVDPGVQMFGGHLFSQPAPRDLDNLPSARAFEMLPPNFQTGIGAAYGAGGFEGVRNSMGDDWFNWPQEIRTQILEGVRRGGR